SRKSKELEPRRPLRARRERKVKTMKANQSSQRFSFFILPLCVLCVLGGSAFGQPKPVPVLQVIPQADGQASFVREDTEIARFHFGAALKRPFLFPIIGPSGRGLTRMGHPHDPVTHSHHNSVWVSHRFVGGVDFWSDNGGRIAHVRVLRYEDGDDAAFAETKNAWVDKENKAVLHDWRRMT